MPFGRGLSGHSLDVLIKEGRRREFGMRTITVWSDGRRIGLKEERLLLAPSNC